MPHPSPHSSQREMVDASCGLHTFYFRRANDSKTDTSILSPAVDQEISKKQSDICDAIARHTQPSQVDPEIWSYLSHRLPNKVSAAMCHSFGPLHHCWLVALASHT
jgi:hypothetical protein